MDLRYPVGKFQRPAAMSDAERKDCIDAIAALPKQIATAVDGLSDAQLDTPYRPDGWTVRQVVHHVADSHINAYCRLRFALAENEPTIKPYDENVWSNFEDAKTLPVTISLALLQPLHVRWVALLRSMQPDQFARLFVHPESGRQTIDAMLALYAWHGRHHTAHITELRKREHWNPTP
jgi:uncharacterized damage-inducible protein DinB